MKKFALIGASGYIAPRHMQAIKDTGNNLVAIMDLNDSVGVIDRYFPHAKFFTNEGKFFNHLDRNRVDYVSVCTPNHKHLGHIRSALTTGAHVICEKPLVTHPDDLVTLEQLSEYFNFKRDINVIMQLRLHPEILRLKQIICKSPGLHSVYLNYVTPRGDWYLKSWKGNVKKSGGILYNIGVHFFDILTLLFHDWKEISVIHKTPDRMTGSIYFRNADVHWDLSLNVADTPNGKPYKDFIVNGKSIDLAQHFTSLHTASYKSILDGKGFSVDEVKRSLKMVHEINKLKEGENVKR